MSLTSDLGSLTSVPERRGRGRPRSRNRIGEAARLRDRREETKDASVPPGGPEKTARIDLGLAIFGQYALPGVSYTCDEIAGWCGCTNSAIQQIESVALRKIRNALRFRQPTLFHDLGVELFDRRTCAVPNERMGA